MMPKDPGRARPLSAPTVLAAFALGMALAVIGWAPPALAATFTVTTTGDTADNNPGDGTCADASGVCTLRAAIQEANALAGQDTIAFSIAGAGVHTITPASTLPPLSDAAGTIIDGLTQPGASANSSSTSDNAVLLIELDGSNTGNTGSDFGLALGANCTVRGLVINRVQTIAVMITTNYVTPQVASNNVVAGNFIGTDPSGTIARPNGRGILVSGLAGTNNLIGGSTVADRNIISGNTGIGIDAESLGTIIRGNFVGVDATGAAARPNALGIALVNDADSSFIGGASPAQRNVISGNTGSGIELSNGPGGGAIGVTIQGNYIGTDATGTAPIGNSRGVNLLTGANATLIGGAAAGEGNVISGNSTGIFFNDGGSASILGNLIGTAADGVSPLGNTAYGIYIQDTPNVTVGGPTPEQGNVVAYNGGNTAYGDGIAMVLIAQPCIIKGVYGNSIHDNADLGIDLGDDGVTPNDPGDPDFGPNLLQNFPVLTRAGADGTQTIVEGTLNSTPSTGYFEIQFYSSPACDASGYGEGETYLGSTLVQTDANGDASFTATLPAVATGSVITATATDPSGNTSEFSACADVHILGVDAIPAYDVTGLLLLATLLALAGVVALGLKSRLG